MQQQLISPIELAALGDANNVVILDASIPPLSGMLVPQHSWPETAIKSARRFDLNANFSDTTNPLPHSMPCVQQFTEQAQKLGINKNSNIVVYDHFGLFSSARAWWMFKSMGHQNITVLNGGLPAWIAAGFPVEKAPSKQVAKGNFVGCYQPQYFCDSQRVLSILNDKKIQVLDARSKARFFGLEAEPRAGVRGGHIPNSINLSYKSLQTEGCLVDTKRLKQSFKEANITQNQLIMSCGSGVTACILALAADILGYKNTQIYDGSWSEWGAVLNLPIAL